jgi:hypothetical protein
LGRKRQRSTTAQRRKRYIAAGWVGVGLLLGLVLGAALLIWQDERAASRTMSVQKAPAPEGSTPPAQPPRPPADELLAGGPRAAIIIDDLGNHWGRARRVSDLPFPVAVAVLPNTPFAERTARRAHAHGKEVLAHMPMQPGDDSIPLGPSFLRADMERGELLATLQANLAAIPYVEGVNNHMGSALTARDEPMGWVMHALRRRGLFFIDSRTTAASRGLDQARSAGIPAAQRDVFLDHHTDEAYVRQQFRTLLRRARQHGTAIGIGHPYPSTLKVLGEMLPEAREQGVRIVPVREVVAVRGRARPEGSRLAYHGPDNEEGE